MSQSPGCSFFVRGVPRNSESEIIVARTADLLGQDQVLEAIEAALPIAVMHGSSSLNFAALVSHDSSALGRLAVVLRVQSITRTRPIVQRRFTLIPFAQLDPASLSFLALLSISLADIPHYEREEIAAPPLELADALAGATLQPSERLQTLRWLLEVDQDEERPLLLKLVDALLSGERVGIAAGKNENAARALVDGIYTLLPATLRHTLPLAVGLFDDRACTWARILMKWSPWNDPSKLVRVETDPLTSLVAHLPEQVGSTPCLYVTLLQSILDTGDAERQAQLIERLASAGETLSGLSELCGLSALPLLLPLVPERAHLDLFRDLLDRFNADHSSLVALFAANSGPVGRAKLWKYLRAGDANKELLWQLWETTADDELVAWIEDPSLTAIELRRLFDQGLSARLSRPLSPALRAALAARALATVELDAVEQGLAAADRRARSLAALIGAPGDRFTVWAAVVRGAFLPRLGQGTAARSGLLADLATTGTLAFALDAPAAAFEGALYRPLVEQATAVGDTTLTAVADSLRAIVHRTDDPAPYNDLGTQLDLDLPRRAELYVHGFSGTALSVAAQCALFVDLIDRYAQGPPPDRRPSELLAPAAEWMRQRQPELLHLLEEPPPVGTPWQRIAERLIPASPDPQQTELERLLLLDTLDRVWPDGVNADQPTFTDLSRRWFRLLADGAEPARATLPRRRVWQQLEARSPLWFPIFRALTQHEQAPYLLHGQPLAPMLIALHNELTLGIGATLQIADRLAALTPLSLDQLTGLLGLYLAFRKPIDDQQPLVGALAAQAPALVPALFALQGPSPDVWQHLTGALETDSTYVGLLADWVLRAGLPDLLRGPLIDRLAERAPIDQAVLAALLRPETLDHFSKHDLLNLYKLIWLGPVETKPLLAAQLGALKLESAEFTAAACAVARLLPDDRDAGARLIRILDDGRQWELSARQRDEIILAAPLDALLSRPDLLDDLVSTPPKRPGLDLFAELRRRALMLPPALADELQQRTQLYVFLLAKELETEAFFQQPSAALRDWRDTLAPHNYEAYYSALQRALCQGLERQPDVAPQTGRPFLALTSVESMARRIAPDLSREREAFLSAVDEHFARRRELLRLAAAPEADS